MNYLHLVKKVAIATLCVFSVANAQDKRFAFKGNAAQAGSGGISTATARQNTGWTASGTLARDTLYTNYAIFGAKTFGVGGTTQAQNARAKFNVLGRASADTLAIFSNDGGGVVGDSSLTINSAGNLGIGGVSDAVTRIYAKTTSNTSTTSALLLQRLDGSALLRVRSDGNSFFGNLLVAEGSGIEDNSYGGYIRLAGTTGAINMASANSNIIRLTPATQVVIGATTTKANQAFLTVNANGTADTTLIVRNDKNSTLDSTAMVFADGRIVRRDTKQLPASAWLATASNGAALSSSNYMVTYAFDTATAETLTVDFALPPNFIQVSNVEIEVISPNTDGDSVGFAVAWLGRAADEAFNVAFSSPLSGQIDLGATANARKILTISGTFDNLAASDRIIFKLWRDPSVDNDVAADVHFVEMRVNGNGLLH